MTFATELVGILTRVTPLDCRFFILPIPRCCKHYIVLFDPRAESHFPRYSSESFDTICTLELNVVATEMGGNHREAFVFLRHSKWFPLDFFTHTSNTPDERIKGARVVVPRLRVDEKITRAVLTAASRNTPALSLVMPEITVSDTLYNKIEEAAAEDDLEPALWEMVYRFERGNGRFE